MRIFSACLALETNTFSPMPTSYRNFLDQQAWQPGEHPAEPTMQTAAFWVTRRRAAAGRVSARNDIQKMRPG